ncbi:MAG TPA: hypothetical protein VGL92_10055 [Acidimicrobiia bacterium]
MPVDAPGRFSAQGMEDGFGWQGRTTHLLSYCVFPSKHDAKMADIKGCFSARRFDEDGDQDGNGYVGEGFRVFAQGKDGYRLHRVKGRAEQPAGEAVNWSPGSDADHGNPSTVTVSAGWNGSGLSTSWNVYPGRVHPWVGRSLFHSSWVTKAGGAPSGNSIQAAGAAVWQLTPGETVRRDGIAEVWVSR